jgi:hypothetical protein
LDNGFSTWVGVKHHSLNVTQIHISDKAGQLSNNSNCE